MDPDRTYELIEHTADVGVKTWGRSMEELFAHAAAGLYAIALSRQPVDGAETVEFTVRGNIREEVLVHFLSELGFLLFNRRLAARSLDLHFPAHNQLAVSGVFGEMRPDDFQLEIKSPTYHKLKIDSQDGWHLAEIYFDV